MATVNIPSYLDDPNYRYKMPKLKAKIEGRGNGIKTNIMNMGEIARSLKRPPEYPTKFCGCELGSASKFEGAEGKAIVNGAHTESDLQLLIDKFIDKFVLCPNCRLPEVDLIVTKSRVRGKCNACGFQGDMENAHKVGTYILKNPPTGGDSTMGKKATKKSSKEERKKERAMKARAKESVVSDEDGEEEGAKADEAVLTESDKKSKKDKKKKSRDREPSGGMGEEGGSKKEKKEKKEKKDKKEKKSSSSSKASKSAVTTAHGSDNDNFSAMGSEEKSPVTPTTGKMGDTGVIKDGVGIPDALNFDSEEIAQVISRLGVFLSPSAGEKPSPLAFFQEVRLLQVAQDFDSVLRVYVALCALLGRSRPNLSLEGLRSQVPYLQAVCDRSVSGDNVLAAFEAYIHRHARESGISLFARICSELYHADLIEEEIFLSRYKTNPTKLSHGAYEEAREAATPFIKWLGQAESASDSESGDSGSVLLDEKDEESGSATD